MEHLGKKSVFAAFMLALGLLGCGSAAGERPSLEDLSRLSTGEIQAVEVVEGSAIGYLPEARWGELLAFLSSGRSPERALPETWPDAFKTSAHQVRLYLKGGEAGCVGEGCYRLLLDVGDGEVLARLAEVYDGETRYGFYDGAALAAWLASIRGELAAAPSAAARPEARAQAPERLSISYTRRKAPFDARTHDFSKIDAHALSVPFDAKTSLRRTVRTLVRPARGDAEKARALVRWIAEHVAYDVASADAGAIGYHDQQPGEVLHAGKAVCAGYARLFYDMATLAGLEAKYITGKARPEGTGHAWNAVRVDRWWYLVDVTWAAGGVDEVGRFVRYFDATWFMTDPALFAQRHVPDDPKWALVEQPARLKSAEETQALGYGRIDDHALSAPPSAEASLGALVDYLTRPAHNDAEVTRAFFRWITDRIAYDAAAVEEERRNGYPARETYIARAFSERRATPAGFAYLFDELCRRAGLWGQPVVGHASRNAGTAGTAVHVWNVVEVEGRRRLFDVTWAAGGVDGDQFVKRFDDRWFMTDPARFAKTHVPKDAEWKLLD